MESTAAGEVRGVQEADELPRIVYGSDLRVISVDAAGRNALPCGRWEGRLRSELWLDGPVQPDPLAAGRLPCSAFLTWPRGADTRTVLAHYRRCARGIEVRFEHLSKAFAFAEHFLDPILVTDQIGNLVHVNPATAQVLSMPTQRFVGRPAVVLGSALGMGVGNVQAMLHSTLTGRSVLDDFVVPTASGRPRRFAIRSSPWRFCGEVCGALWLAVETTYSEQRDLELVSAAWYRMSATYQHELRNPLQTMQAAVDLGRLRDDGRNTRVFDILDQSVKMMSDFMADQLQPWSGTPAPRCSLSAIVEEEVALARVRHSTAGLQVHHEPIGDEPPVRVHRAAMTRVFANLFRNVAQAHAAATVDVRYHCEDGALVCTVTDDGPGFPPEMLNPGWLHEGDPRKHLGLAIVAATVEACGGCVRWENCPEGGAQVTIRVPVAAAPEADRRPSTPRKGGGPRPAASGPAGQLAVMGEARAAAAASAGESNP